MSEDAGLHVDRRLLSAAAALARYPAVNLGTVAFSGRENWDFATRRSTPGDRWALLQQLEQPLLVALPVGRERLAANSRHHDEDHRDPLPCVYGDSWLLPLVRQALALTPSVVRSCVVRECAWLGVGRACVAWTSSSVFCGDDEVAKPRVVVCGPGTTLETCLHESVHVFNHDVHNLVSAISVEGAASLLTLAEAEGWSGRIEDNQAMHEVLATALAKIWLYRSPEGRPA